MLYVRGSRAQSESSDPATGAARAAGGGGGLNVRGLPLVKPPYGTHHGDRHEQGRAALENRARRDARQHQESSRAEGIEHSAHRPQGRIGVLTTKTLLIAGEGGFQHYPEGRGAMLRAYDKATGAEAGAVFMPAPQTGSPMTYSVNGTQYIAVAVSGPGFPGELLVYKLGSVRPRRSAVIFACSSAAMRSSVARSFGNRARSSASISSAVFPVAQTMKMKPKRSR